MNRVSPYFSGLTGGVGGAVAKVNRIAKSRWSEDHRKIGDRRDHSWSDMGKATDIERSDKSKKREAGSPLVFAISVALLKDNDAINVCYFRAL